MPGFQDIIGQDQIKEHLQNAIKLQKVSHAYILHGERASGKEFIANVFSMALNCESKDEKPCLTCHSCKQTMTLNQPDIIRITHEKPASIGVDDIRNQINGDIGINHIPVHLKYILFKKQKK
jgi:DNA polymerase III subunit delta'